MLDEPPLITGTLTVPDGHELYWEESGAPEGMPAIWLHGGPGSGLGTGGYRKRFDPERWRVIGYDQRGCGRSVPRATSPGYDLSVSSPLATAWELYRRLPLSELLVVESGGHGGPTMTQLMRGAIGSFLP